MNKIISNILRFLLLIIIQVLICNRVHLFGFINPYIYILALLLLPFDIPKWAQYLIAFFTGLIIDAFAMTYGVHASSSLLIMFIKPYLVNLLNGKRTADGIEKPIPGEKDFQWLLLYTFILVFVHHFTITLLETFNLKELGWTLLTSIGNTTFTTLVVLCLEYLFIPAKKR